MKAKTINHIIIPLLIVSIYGWYASKRSGRYNQQQTESLQQLNDEYYSIIRNSFEYNGAIIQDNIVLGDLNDDDVLLSKLLDDDNVFLFFSGRACTQCVQEQLQILQKRSPDYNRIIIIAWYENIRDLAILLSLYELPNTVYYLKNHTSLSRDYHDIGPYYFSLSHDGKYCRFFSPIKGNYNLTNLFLSTLFINSENL